MNLINIKEILLNNKTIIENYFFMTVLQVLNSFFFLAIYPYLIRSLGVESYGLYVFATSVVAYFIVLVNFGFDMPATKSIVLLGSDVNAKSHVLSCIFTAKVYLEIIFGVVFLVLILIIPVFNQHWKLYVICFGNTIVGILFPIWYFQAIQKMRIVTYIQLFFKILSLPFIFLLVKEKTDVELFALISTLVNIIGAFIATLIIRYGEKIHINWVRFKEMRIWFKNGMPFFWSLAAGAVKEQSIIIIIGSFFNMKDVALYDLANKIVIVPRTLVMSINGALFPKLATNVRPQIIKKIIFLEYTLGLSIIVCVILSGRFIVLFLGGTEMLFAYPMAIFLSLTVLTWLVVGAYINFIFIPKSLYYYITKNQIIAFTCFFCFCFLGLFFILNILVLVISIALAGISELLFCAYVVKKKKLLSVN